MSPLRSIADRWQHLAQALGLPPEVAALMRPTFVAGFGAALGALAEIGNLPTEEQAAAALLAWHTEIQQDADRLRTH